MCLVPYNGGGTGGSLPAHCPVLTGENYTVWAIKVKANLDAAGLCEAVVPAVDSAPAVITKKDKPARAYLLGALSKEILLQVCKEDGDGAMEQPVDSYVGANRVRAARLATLQGDFERLHMTEAESLDAFAGKVGGIVARYTALGATLEDAAMIKKLLDSVRDRNAAVAGTNHAMYH